MNNAAYNFTTACMAMLAVLIIGTASAQAQAPTARIVTVKTVATTDDAGFNFFNASQGATRYRWLTGDGAAIDGENLSWEFSDIGYYKVSLIAYKDEKVDTSSVQVTVLRGANYGNPLLDPTLGPNPATLSENKDCD